MSRETSSEYRSAVCSKSRRGSRSSAVLECKSRVCNVSETPQDADRARTKPGTSTTMRRLPDSTSCVHRHRGVCKLRPAATSSTRGLEDAPSALSALMEGSNTSRASSGPLDRMFGYAKVSSGHWVQQAVVGCNAYVLRSKVMECFSSTRCSASSAMIVSLTPCPQRKRLRTDREPPKIGILHPALNLWAEDNVHYGTVSARYVACLSYESTTRWALTHPCRGRRAGR